MRAPAWLDRIRRPFVAWALAALAWETVVELLLRRNPSMPRGAHTLLALSPLVPLLMFVFALARTIMRMDELQKLICLESVFTAFLGSLTLTFVFAALSQAGAYRPPWDEIGTVMLALWASAYLYTSWKYR